MLKRINIVHVGDVHYPEAIAETLADVKDAGFPSALSDLARLKPLTCVARKLTAMTDRLDAVLFTGDLTTYGDPTGYRDCLNYFNGLINFKRWPLDRLHAVPGNHDIDRHKVDPLGTDLYTKFEDFDQAWKALGIPILATNGVRQSTISVPKATTSGVTMFSLNSSLGCGERRYPKQIQEELGKLLDAYASTVPKAAAFELLGETLDTPAFAQNEVEDVCFEIGNMARTSLPIVVAHHNILPQSVPRIAIYTDLINAGMVRSRFSHLQRPIIYCHGHIHDHPVEVISEPEYPGSKLICVSAPKFSAGFNVISIEFSSLGSPLGCVICSYRLNNRDAEIRGEVLSIPFHSPTYDNVRQHGGHALPNILANLPDGEIRIPELLTKLSMKSAQANNLANSLLEGEWLGALELRDKREELMHWIVRKVIR